MRSMGYEIWHINRGYSLAMFLRRQTVDVVLDVGGNIGQFAEYVRNGGFKGSIVSFEPVTEAAELLRQQAQYDRNWQVHECALGSTVGEGVLNISTSTVFSSLRELTVVASNFGSGPTVVARRTVRIRTLDDLVPTNVGTRIFLKLDTQGYDQDVLEGGKKTLERVVGIQLELSSTPLYENAWDIPDALRYLRGLGFCVCQVSPVNFIHDDSSTALEFDFVLVRRKEKMSGEGGCELDKHFFLD